MYTLGVGPVYMYNLRHNRSSIETLSNKDVQTQVSGPTIV